jgi:tRNA(Ile)-lysidine synthase
MTHTYYCDNSSSLEQAVAAHIRRHELFRNIKRLGLAVSGGADSVALLHLLPPLCREAGVAFKVLHLNHGLRTESADEEKFMRQLCAMTGTDLVVEHARLAEQPQNGLSMEMAARKKRMEFFSACSRELELDAIATGHNADDVAETLLLRLIRGAGASGLSGLRPVSEVDGCRLIRPLLTISGQALRQWLHERGLSWCEDASNLDTTIQRNHIRHNLLPRIERECQPGARARFCRTAEILRCDDLLLEDLAARELAEMDAEYPGSISALPVSRLLQQPLSLQRRILRQWLFRQTLRAPADFESVTEMLDLCERQSEWQRDFAGNVTVRCRNGLLTVSDTPPPEPPPPLDLSPDTHEPARWGDFEISLERGVGIHDLANGVGVYPAMCSLSADILQGRQLQVRARQPGDRISPTGFSGAKKIKDLLIDAKVPKHLRGTIPLFACDDEIIWVPGYRIDRRFAVPSQIAPSVVITIRRV